MSAIVPALQKENDKLKRQLIKARDDNMREHLKRDLIISKAARERLMVHMYTQLFAASLESIEEDIANAGTLSEARAWAMETINKFKPMLVDKDGGDERTLDGFIEFNHDSVQLKFNEIKEQMKQEWIK